MLRAMKVFGRRIDADSVTVERDSDGTFGPCYFCGATVSPSSDFAILIVERVDPEGEPIHAACHGSCAEHARHA
jgi:hypothetical protein